MADIKALSDRISQYGAIKRFDQPDEPQGWTIAWTLSEIDEFCETFQMKRLPAVLSATSEVGTLDALHEILEDYRRARRHMRLAAFFGDLLEDECEDEATGRPLSSDQDALHESDE